MSDWNITYIPERDHGTIIHSPTGLEATVQFQNGPVGDNGINGVKNEEIIDLLCVRLRDLNKKFPCRENSLAITKLEEANMWLRERTRLRAEQGVEGKNLAHVS